VILLALLATAGLAIVAAFLRAADRDVGPPSPSALATVVGLVTALLLAYRILQPPGLNDAAVVKWGAPVGLALAGVLGIASRSAMRAPPREDVAEDADTDETVAVAPDPEDEQSTPPAGYESPPSGEPATST
jgi:hypothetical protein